MVAGAALKVGTNVFAFSSKTKGKKLVKEHLSNASNPFTAIIFGAIYFIAGVGRSKKYKVKWDIEHQKWR